MTPTPSIESILREVIPKYEWDVLDIKTIRKLLDELNDTIRLKVPKSSRVQYGLPVKINIQGSAYMFDDKGIMSEIDPDSVFSPPRNTIEFTHK